MKKILFILLLLKCSSLLYAINNSDNFTFEMARPCWTSEKQKEFNYMVALHKSFEADKVSSAFFRIAACSNYRLYLNGEFIGYGPSITAHGFFRVDEYDLLHKIKVGTNVLAIEVCGYNIDNFHIPNQSAFVQAELILNDKVVVATLPTKKAESFDFADSGQREPIEIGVVWQRPHLEKYRLKYDFKEWRVKSELCLPKLKIEETDKKNIISRNVPYPDYLIKSSKLNQNGEFSFERIHTGFIIADLTVTKPSKVKFYWDEVLVDGRIQKLRQPQMNMSLELEPGHYVFETFEPYTLMHIKLAVEEGDCKLNSVSIRQYVNADVNKVLFKTNDTDLNKIFEAAVETYKQNAVDYFMDCPERERAGWLCDSYFTSRSAFYISGNTKIEHNFLENFALPAKFSNIPEGMIPMCYPSDHKDGNFIPNWAMWLIIELEEYLYRSNDYEMLTSLKPKILGLLDYLEAYRNGDLLLEDLNKWVFVEWSAANTYTEGVNYPTNMLYSRILEIAGNLYSIPRYIDDSRKIKETICRQSYIDGFFRDNAIRKNGRLELQIQNCSEVCQYYAFFFNVASFNTHSKLWISLVNDFGPIRKKAKLYPDIPKTNAFIGNYLRLELLSKAGLTKKIIEESKSLFLYMANSTGTLWENITTSGSCCHGFASHAAAVYMRDIVGIKNIDLRNRRIDIEITNNELKECKVQFPIKDDIVSIDWHRIGNRMTYKVKYPSDYELNIYNNANVKLALTEEKIFNK